MSTRTAPKTEPDDLRALNILIYILTCALFGGLAWAFTTPAGQLLLEVLRSQP